MASCSNARNNVRGKCLHSQSKQIVLNVYSKLLEQNPDKPITVITDMVADLTGVSVASIFRARRELKIKGKLSTPKKSHSQIGITDRLTKYDDFEKTAIRRKVHDYFFCNECPTLKQLLTDVNNDDSLPTISRATIHRLLRDLGFRFEKRARNSLLIERDDIISWRHKYLRKIRSFRRENRSIYYLDETWCNASQCLNNVWQDKTIQSTRDAFMKGLSTGVKNPSGAGERLIILHAGSINGFVNGVGRVFKSKKTIDYHEEMNGDYFEKWFKEFLPKLNPNSVIVLDNAPYHSVKEEKLPTKSWTKSDIQAWLNAKCIDWQPDMLKSELMEIVNNQRSRFNSYRIDKLAAEAGHTVLRLPPYHCELNPIELIWSQMKGYVARRNTTWKLSDVKILLEEAINTITPKSWSDCIDYVKKIEEKFWILDGLLDEDVPPVIINTAESTESDTDLSDVENLL